jgi:hypothetical protein
VAFSVSASLVITVFCFGSALRWLQLKRALAFSVKFIGVGGQRSSFTPARQCQIGTSSVLFLLLGKGVNQLRVWCTW